MENQIDIEVPKDITVKLQGLPIILKKGTKVFCRQINFDFAMKEYEEWEKTKNEKKVLCNDNSSPLEARVMQKIADLIEYHKQEASEPFLTLKTLKNFKTDKIEVKKIQRAMNGYTKMMKKKHLEWIKILESNFSA